MGRDAYGVPQLTARQGQLAVGAIGSTGALLREAAVVPVWRPLPYGFLVSANLCAL
jgi:hypothetical protein